MKNKNDYGFYSGGYIFDRLDRSALYAVRKGFDLWKANLYTSGGEVAFERQLCDLDKTRVFTDSVKKIGDNTYEVKNVLRKCSISIARATFCFKIAHHNYCATKKD